MNNLKALSSKYEIVVDSLNARDSCIREKIEEIKKSIDAIRRINEAEDDLVIDYELGGTLFAKAKIANNAKVNLWLGANVLLEYEPREAIELLEKKLKDNQAILQRTMDEQRFAREQLTIVQVNLSRMINLVIESRKVKK